MLTSAQRGHWLLVSGRMMVATLGNRPGNQSSRPVSQRVRFSHDADHLSPATGFPASTASVHPLPMIQARLTYTCLPSNMPQRLVSYTQRSITLICCKARVQRESTKHEIPRFSRSSSFAKYCLAYAVCARWDSVSLFGMYRHRIARLEGHDSSSSRCAGRRDHGPQKVVRELSRRFCRERSLGPHGSTHRC